MQYYPLFLDLRHKHILVVGGGEVGMRKLITLVQSMPASLHVVDPTPSSALKKICSQNTIVLHERTFLPEDIQGKTLVFAATAIRAVNSFVADLCHSNNILCNIADAPSASDFFVPATIYQGPICVAISTHGSSPALSRHIRQELEDWLGNRYTALAVLLGRLRPLLLAQASNSAQNGHVLRQIVRSPLGQLLANNDFCAARKLLYELLPTALHTHIGDLLHDL